MIKSYEITETADDVKRDVCRIIDDYKPERFRLSSRFFPTLFGSDLTIIIKLQKG